MTVEDAKALVESWRLVRDAEAMGSEAVKRCLSRDLTDRERWLARAESEQASAAKKALRAAHVELMGTIGGKFDHGR